MQQRKPAPGLRSSHPSNRRGRAAPPAKQKVFGPLRLPWRTHLSPISLWLAHRQSLYAYVRSPPNRRVTCACPDWMSVPGRARKTEWSPTPSFESCAEFAAGSEFDSAKLGAGGRTLSHLGGG